MRTISQIRSRVMKMSHVRRSVDAKLFGKVQSWAEYVRGAWETVKAEIAKAIEEARIEEARKAFVRPTAEACAVAEREWCLAYYADRSRTYFGD